ncbi:Transglutaminase-like enzyme, putative cysteine protease [Lachnospiraceae bacterium G41]|nr:Transglutaminase-like enzyme, putative cysteine protease [Lachnospiraceae bacterium G41]
MISWLDKIIYKKEIKDNKLIVGEVTQTKKSNRFLICLFKGILVYIATYCSICGLLDAFEIEYNRPIIMVAFAFFSFYVSFLYFNKLIFYIFYIILFVAFTVELARYYMAANSGFQAAINIIFEEYSDYFGLAAIREGYESVTNRYLTVTIAALFLGAFTAILLNVTISGYMNAFETALVTFPYIEVALFIHKIPSAIYLFGLLFVYTCVVFLQFSRHSRMQVKGKRTHEFLRIKMKKENRYAYQADIPVFLYSFAFSFVISLVIIILLKAPLNMPISKVPGNAIHKQTQEYVKILVQNGIGGFLDTYTSTGGLSGGRIGGVSQVRPDYETDLEVTFVPINYDTIYLKGYTGTNYQPSGWFPLAHDLTYLEDQREYDFGNTAKIMIKEVDADPKFDYRPYFSSTTDIEHSPSDYNTYEITYKPVLSSADYAEPKEDELLILSDYYEYVYDACLVVPEDLKPVLDETLKEINPVKTDDINQYRINCANAIYVYFLENFNYTMAPGRTAYKRDFVEYFLTHQKRGFCAHFASATVLLLREMGVPARYCEGYCIPITLIYEDAILTDNNFDEWYSGKQDIELQSVLEVPVNDSYAHAWVEIYLDGYGFVPFEATIPSFDEEDNDLGFLTFNFFSAITRNTLNFEQFGTTNNPNNGNNSGFNINKVFDIFNFNTAGVRATVVIIFVVFIGAFLLFLLTRFLIIRIKLTVYRKNNDEYHLVIYEYSKLSAMLKRKGYLKKDNPLPMDVKEAYDLYLANYNNRHKKQKDVDTKALFEHYEKVMYS